MNDRVVTLFAAMLLLVASGRSAEPAEISAARQDPAGWLVHDVPSPFQVGTTEIRVLLPEGYSPQQRLPAIYLLPVEGGRENRFGDGLLEVLRQGLHRKFRAVFVAPTFAQLPWYADHPADPGIQQERHFLEVVVPFVERAYAVSSKPTARLLLGFSKSGWGAWCLLLRHPALFGRAVAWDAPLMMDAPDKYGSGRIFGTPENFRQFQISRLIRQRAELLRPSPRLCLLGYSGFRGEHQAMHALLEELRVPHVYRDGPQRAHDWHSGWVEEAIEVLLAGIPDHSEQVGD